jgi:FMN phosphatase YigB (HAD superfamily)
VAGAPQDAVIFDMDGTLCDVRGVRHLLDGPGRFHAFHTASASCPPNAEVVAAARAEHAAGRAVLIVTARSVRYRAHTAMWLALHDVPSDAMWMRAARDMRPDYEVKRDILAAIRRRYRPVAAWDDNPAVLRLWREQGIAVRVVPGWDGEAGEAPANGVPPRA